MAYLTIYENMDDRQPLVFKGHGTETILRKLHAVAMANRDRCDGWCVGNPNERESHAYMQYIEGYNNEPDMSWEFFDSDIHRPGESEVDNFWTVLIQFETRCLSNINMSALPKGASRLAKGQIV